MKAILKFKPLLIILAFMIMVVSSANATSYVGNSSRGIGEYELMILPVVCPICGSHEWFVAEDGTGSVYHILCAKCGHNEFPPKTE